MSHALFDTLRVQTNTVSDAALARLLGVKPPEISKGRTVPQIIGPVYMARIQEKTGMPVARIKELMSDASPKVDFGKQVRQAKEAKPAKQSKPAEPLAFFKPHRLTVTKTPKWTSTVHRMR